MHKPKAKLNKTEKSLIKSIDLFVWAAIVIAALIMAAR